jgi:pyruvate/2-oxoglutarate dehydrogenase complex dihydrolipoamide dehydrogenase (E3) component
MSTLEIPATPFDEYDRILVKNAHPPGWKNPEPRGRYNLVVIGGGTAGLVSAAGAAMLGARVALVESRLMGGDCLNYGCVPSKALIRAGRAAHAVQQAAEFGIFSACDPLIDFAEVMRRVRRVRAHISEHDSAERFKSLGIDVFLGHARFASPSAVEVDGRRLEFTKAIIATGARPAELPVPGFEKIGYLTNETVFSLTRLPKRLIVVGSGPIGCELGQAFRRLGSHVTILSSGDRLLPKDDCAAALLLQQQFEREGIHLKFGARILKAQCTPAGKTLVFERGQGEESVSADEILVAVGRAANVEGLNLEAAGIRSASSGVVVDDHLRTSNHHVYAAGDVASAYQFTHAAEAMARIALQNAFFFGSKRSSNLMIPWVTYTDPEVAHVGLTAEQVRSKSIAAREITLPFSENDRALTDGDNAGFARVLVARGNGRILGATIINRHAGEMIGELVLAVQKQMKLNELSSVIHPYPTQAEVIKRLGDESLRSRLKPWIKRALAKFFAWRR